MFAGLSSATNWKLNSAYWSHGLISLKCGNEGVALTKNFARIKTRPNCIVAKVYLQMSLSFYMFIYETVALGKCRLLIRTLILCFLLLLLMKHAETDLSLCKFSQNHPRLPSNQFTILTLTEICVFLFKITFYTTDALEHLPSFSFLSNCELVKMSEESNCKICFRLTDQLFKMCLKTES